MTQEKLPHRKELCLQSERNSNYLSSVLDYYFSKSIVLSNSLICSTLNHSVLLPEL